MQPSPFFLKAGSGQRFCVFHPATGSGTRAAILYVHPFAEEMNKSRRMANLQCQAFAKNGLAVLQIDLNGCGDSSGDYSDATWQSWHDDIAMAWDYLKSHHDMVYLWGLRLGATLALDFANVHNRWPSGFLLWQPVLSGETFMTQFLRLRVANEMIEGGGGGVKVLREMAKRGEVVEVAGYGLNPALIQQVDAVQIRKVVPKYASVYWLEVVHEDAQPASSMALQIVESWRQANLEVTLETVTGAAFWATQEITVCPAMIERTINRVARVKP